MSGSDSNFLTLNGDRSPQKQSKLEQVVDDKGNVLEQRVYDYGSLSTPARVYANTYLSGTGYASRYIFNRLVSSVVTAGGVQTTLAANYYDQYDTPYTYCSQFFPTLAPRSGLRQHDGVNYGPAMKWRGNVTAGGRAGGVWRCFSHDITGLVTAATDAGGMRVDVNPTANNAVPGLITPNSNGALSETLNWNSFLGLTSDSGPNGAVTSYGYDGAGRPSSVTTPHGATISLSYSASPPLTTRTVNPGGGRPVRWTKTYHDGLGRPVRVEEGHGTTVVSIVETEYEACACSPLGKVKRVSRPYAPGGTVYWTTYSYDNVGRLISVAQPDSSGTTTYAYSGNTVTVTDAAGKWKKFTRDAMGNLVKVEEPGGLITNYSYNGLNQLVEVRMPRGTATQVRSFSYSSGFLVSATHPESGTTQYGYNSGALPAWKTDAKGQRVEYSYDAYRRLIEVRRYVGGVEQGCQRVNLTYDAEYFGGGSNTLGRLARVDYAACGSDAPAFSEFYRYTPGGLVAEKRLRVTQLGATAELAATWSYDGEGKVTAVNYPNGGGSYSFAHDALGRLERITEQATATEVASGALYGPAGELRSLVYYGRSETRQYNSLGQLTRLTVSGAVDLEYRYSATQNNGRITQMKDWVSGEEVNYQYDALNRLASAETTGAGWGQAFGYDGFGNLVSQTVTKGSAPSLTVAVNPANNRMVGWTYDANGNLLWSGYTYDVENRLLTAPWEECAYDGNNRRVWKRKQVGEGQYREEVYFYGVGGERLGTYRAVRNGAALTFETVADNLYFNGRLIRSGREVVAVDRLGSVRWRGNLDTGATAAFDYWPYGQEKPSATVQEREKFGTYYRDATGLDYADQRYYASHWGRFLTADPFASATALENPTRGWNRYAYAEGDPVNYGDPAGLCVVRTEEGLSPGADCLEEVDIGDYSPGAAIQGAGSGAGGTPAALFIRVRDPSKIGPQQSRITKVLNWIRDNIDSDCAEWLKDVKTRIDEVLGDGTEEGTFIGHADLDNRYVSAFTGSNPKQTDAPAGFAITINRQGAFFYGSFWDGRVMRPLTSGGFPGGTNQAQVFILLHELAHSLGAAGFQADFGDEAAGRANDSLVRKHCRKTLDAARRMR